MKKYINMYIVLFSLTYILFGIYLIYMVLSKKTLLYITPKISTYVLLFSIIVILFGMYNLSNISKKNIRPNIIKTSVILIPLILLIIPRNTSISTSANGFIGSDVSNNIIPNASQPKTFNYVKQKPPSLEEANTLFDTKDKKLIGLDEENKTITINDNNFYPWIAELFVNKKYIGYTVKVKGFVYHNKDYMKDNQFAPARNLMTCCVADLVPVGLICNYDNIHSLKEGEWVNVTGKLIFDKYLDREGPQLNVEKVEPTDKPEIEYVYP